MSEMEKDFLHELDGWERAYPQTAFPEPDLKRAAEVLKANGMTLDAISASNMRHVVQFIAPKARALITSQAAEIEGLLDRLAETQMLAMRWMEAHDKLKAGAPYSFPRPSDLPDEVRRLREALEWVAANSTNEGVGDIDFRFVSARRARTALQHEGGGRG